MNETFRLTSLPWYGAMSQPAPKEFNMLAKKIAWIAGGAIGALAIAYPFTISAQSAADGQQGPPPGQIQPGQGGGIRGGQGGEPGPAQGGPGRGGAFGGQRPGMMMGGPGGGGGAAMVHDNTHLYIFTGGTVYKVAKSDLKVDRKGQVIETPVPMDMAPGAQGGGVGGFGGGAPRGGGIPEADPTID